MGEADSNPATPRPATMAPRVWISAPPSQLHSPSLSRSPLLGSPDGIGVSSKKGTPKPASMPPRSPISAPPSQLHSPSLSRSPFLASPDVIGPASKKGTPRPSTPSRLTPARLTPRFITPLGSPLRKVLKATKLDPSDAWLPITESRNGNAYYAAFHTLCAGIGSQALLLPVAFTILGWAWGAICLTLIFIWQLYTLYILVQLHESVEEGVRYSRYLQLSCATFGERLGNWLVFMPLGYLSVGTCIALLMIGGSTMKIFFQTVCGTSCAQALTPVEWYLVFACAAAILSQLPNLNSIAGVSLIGALTAVGYCTAIWVISVDKGRLPNVSYKTVRGETDAEHISAVLNAIGIVAFAFRGHNLTLEIQATMPSSQKHPSTVPMWKGVKVAYLIIAMCLFPIAIGGYWAYGQLIPQAGILTALNTFHAGDTSRFVMALISLFVIINSVSSFQIYAMQVFDDTESMYTRWKKKPCPWWLRSMIRVVSVFFWYFLAVALPFVGSVAGLVGGLGLPVTLAYPCFMWLKIRKPKEYSRAWFLNLVLGVLGIILSVVTIVAGIYVIVRTGVKVSFFDPQ